MGVIKQGILGGFSGKVANVVGSSWKGIAVLKSLPLSVANPNTAGQQEQRGKMREVVAAARILLASIIQPFWNPFAQGMSGYNRFVSTNIDAFDETSLATPGDFYSQRGSLLGAPITSVVADDSGNTIIVNWTNNTGQSDALATDEANIVVYNTTKLYWLTDVGNAIRSAATRTISDSTMTAGDVLAVYLGFTRPDVSKVSDSDYEAATVVA